MPSLTVQADGTAKRYTFEAPTITMGRGLECDIRLKDIKGSRRHCQVVKTGEGYKVVDLASGNGTYLNGVQISEQPLKHGDKIQIGTTVITFQATAPVTQAVAKTQTGKTAITRPGTRRTATGVTRKPTTAIRKTTVGSSTQASPPMKPTSDMRPQTSRTVKPTGRTGLTTRATKTGTGRVTSGRKGTRGMGKTTVRVSRTERFTQQATQASKKNMLPVIAGIAGGVVMLAIVVIMLLPMGDSGALEWNEYNQIVGKANQALDEKKFEESRSFYEAALKYAADHKENDQVRQHAKGVENTLSDIVGNLNSIKDAQKKWEDFKRAYDDLDARGERTPQDMESWGKSLQATWAGKPKKHSWEPQLQDCLDVLKKLVNNETTEQESGKYQNVLKRIEKEFLSGPKKEWSGAIREWKTFVEKAGAGGPRRHAENKITSLISQANKELHDYGLRVERGAMTVAEVKAERLRFAGGDERLDELYEKKVKEVGGN